MSTHLATCSICLDDIGVDQEEKEITTLDCNHSFHTHCISQLRSNKCPGCRTRFTSISPEILSAIQRRESADEADRLREENINVLLNSFASFLNPPEETLPPLDLGEGRLRPSSLFLQNLIRVAAEDEGVGVHEAGAPPPPPCLFWERPSAVPPPLSLRTVLGSVAPSLVSLLNTPFRGASLNSRIEDYILQNTCEMMIRSNY
ncbi:hypothetical protein KAS50_05505 [bacterium]|nr:hypothetical protein [bacterium]